MSSKLYTDYFRWLVSFVRSEYQGKSYWNMLYQLFHTPYIFELEMDANRANDGLDLRRRFEDETGFAMDFNWPCSVLEMTVALALRIETDIMYIPNKGDRTYIWFWTMIENLDLLRMSDDCYDEVVVRAIIFNFLNRMYEPDGKGGLFYVPGHNDMKDMEIWYQMNMYLNSLVEC